MDTEDYPEFEALSQIDNDVDAAVYLLKLAKRYNAVADLAKKKANELLNDIDAGEIIESSDGTRIRMVSKKTTKVDTSVLQSEYSDIYTALCNAGEVSISMKAIKDLDIPDALVSTSSKYAELCR